MERSEDLWEQIGFHKPVAGFWYNLILFLIEIIFGIFLSGALLSYFFPFPESNGYISTVNDLFALLFIAFDVGTNQTMDRFISESRISDPTRMLHYIQYFIWYQMITGLIQVSAIAIYALYFVNSSMSYLVWIMLIVSTIQYPGFLGVFGGVLNSLQYYDKTNLINFTQGQIIQRTTELLFVFLGKSYGESHPEIGIIMGIAFGAAIGRYIDDFIGVLFASYFFGKAMRHINIRPRDCFKIGFDWELVKETFLFGLKTSLPSLLNSAVSLYILLLWINYVPQYTTFIALLNIAGGIIGYIGKSFLQLTALYSESYMNGKKNLTQYILGQSWRFSGQMAGFFITIFSVVYFVLTDAFIAFGIEYYLEAIPFMIPSIFARAIISFTNPANQILAGADKPNILFYGQCFEQIIHVTLHYLFIVVWNLPGSFTGLVFTLVFGRTIGYVIKDSLMYWYVQKKIIRIKIPWYQTFLAPTFASLVCLCLGLVAKILIYDPLYRISNFIVAIIPIIAIFVIIGVFVYFPLTAFFGGWDNENTKNFEKVVQMSGPSKFLVAPMFRAVQKFIKISPWHNKFGMDPSKAIQDANDLYQLKMQHNLTNK